MDQMIKATLASVGPNNIDVRNEAGDTLLVLACQHGCEVRVLVSHLVVCQKPTTYETARSLSRVVLNRMPWIGYAWPLVLACITLNYGRVKARIPCVVEPFH